MSRNRSHSSIGWSSGLFQSASYLVPQLAAAIALSLGLPENGLDWIALVGYLGPLVVSLLMTSGDAFGGRKLIVGTAALACAGVAILALGGLLNAVGLRGPAVVAVVAGVCLIPVAFRHGALTAGHQTLALHGDVQLREARALRRYVVLGRYAIPLPVILVSLWFGWTVAFALLALLQLRALVLLRRGIEDKRASRVGIGTLETRSAGWLAWAAAGAFLTQCMVFMYVAGMPVVLARYELDGWTGAVLSAAVLAALLVTRPKRMSSPRFGRLAGAVPVAALIAASLLTLPVGRHGNDGLGAGVLIILVFAGLSVVMELANQWGQSLGPLQARAGASVAKDYRRRAVVELGANFGPPAGFVLGQHLGNGGSHASPALSLLLPLLGFAAGAWLAAASWFVAFPHPWTVDDLGHGRTRVCLRGREFIVVTTADSRASRTVIYEVDSKRPLVEFDPLRSTLAEQLARLIREARR